MSKKTFQTEVSQLLHLIIHSLYSNKEIFIRELISNASDALDKLRYLTLTDDAYKSMSFEPSIQIQFSDKDPKTLTIIDNGIGMNQEDLEDNLGTIARSGTRNFLAQLTGDARKDSSLIGQFGVGFYSSFMAADKVEVHTRKAGEEKGWLWKSDGKSEYEITELPKEDGHGTRITLYLNDNGSEFATQWTIRSVIRKYSDHIAFPIFLHYEKAEYDDKGTETGRKQETEQVNNASALWKKSKSELKDTDYTEFYKTVSHDMDDPLFHLHTKAEGVMEYTTLFYVPKKAPFDMYQVDYRPGVKLYVKRVFITDDAKELLPPYLRFVRGIIDSEDLPLNVSREILQQNAILTNIKNSSVKRLLGEFARIAAEDKDKYLEFAREYNRPLKEGLYTDFANRETLLDLIRVKSTKTEGDQLTSLAEYKERMIPDQKAVYYITGGSAATLGSSPLLEAYRSKNIEVLILDHDIDEIVFPMVGKYKELEFKAVNRSDAGDELSQTKDQNKEDAIKPVLEKIKAALGEQVKDVVVSVRLAESPSCIVVDQDDPTFQMQAMLRAMGHQEMQEVKPILEINPDHNIVKSLEKTEDESLVADISHLLLNQAMLAEGLQVKEPADFVKRLNRVMELAL